MFLAAAHCEKESNTCVLVYGGERQHAGVSLLCVAACRKCRLMWSDGPWSVGCMNYTCF